MIQSEKRVRQVFLLQQTKPTRCTGETVKEKKCSNIFFSAVWLRVCISMINNFIYFILYAYICVPYSKDASAVCIADKKVPCGAVVIPPCVTRSL